MLEDIAKIVVKDLATGDELAIITTEEIITLDDNIIVELYPRETNILN